jgi:hypothetical protein
MIELRTRILLGLLTLLAAAPEASPQIAQSGLPTRQAALRKTGKFGKNGSSPATGAMPGLCFQPGVGWQPMLKQPSGPATLDTNTSMGLEERGSASGANPQSAYARLSNPKQAQSNECPEILTDKRVLGAGAEKFTILNRPKPGTVTSLRVNSPYHANGSAGLEPAGMMPSAITPTPNYFAPKAEPDAHPDQVGVRAFHVYISSIKLRRLIRNAPDFRTRIKLQQLQNKPATQLHRTRVGASTATAARRTLQGERLTRSLGVRP